MHTEDKREKEKETIELMVKLYCKRNHKNKVLCEECRSLLEYSLARTDNCRFMETKTFCANCKSHCYKPEMREKIKKVMRYAGPRMIYSHPILAISHVISTKKEQRKQS